MGIFRKRGKYYIDFYADGKRVRECVGPVSRRVAADALSVRKAEVAQGRYQLRARQRAPLFADFARDYLEFSRAHKAPRTAESDQTRMLHLAPFFGRYRLDEITRFLVDKYVYERRRSASRRGRPVSPATINRELAALKHMFTKAIEWGRAEKNPVRGVPMLKQDPPRQRVLSFEEEERLLRACAPHVRMAVLLATNAGLRLGEVMALRWRDIDLEGGILRVEHGKGNRRREVEINSRLRNELASYRGLAGRSDYLFFNERTGRPILDPKTAFRAAVRRSGIGPCRFHDLRHTFATRLVTAGADLVTVKELLGHATIEMTLRYSHPGRSERRRAVELLADGHHMDTTGAGGNLAGSAKILKTLTAHP
jgi:integrase